MAGMDPAKIGLYVAALTPVAGAIGWALRAILATWRASIAAVKAVADLQHADSERMIDALLAAARADDAHRASIDALIEEVRAAAAWRQGTVYRPRPPE